ncbi:hypothetical protein [Acinetobacter baumannii]
MIANLQIAVRLARSLDAVDLADHDEPAPLLHYAVAGRGHVHGNSRTCP